jgi:hypothetical protein
LVKDFKGTNIPPPRFPAVCAGTVRFRENPKLGFPGTERLFPPPLSTGSLGLLGKSGEELLFLRPNIFPIVEENVAGRSVVSSLICPGASSSCASENAAEPPKASRLVSIKRIENPL